MVPQSQQVQQKSSLRKKFSGIAKWQVNIKKNPVLEPCVFTNGKS